MLTKNLGFFSTLFTTKNPRIPRGVTDVVGLLGGKFQTDLIKHVLSDLINLGRVKKYGANALYI